MKVFFTADLHWDVCKEPQRVMTEVAKKVIESKADVLLIGGDTATGLNKEEFTLCLNYFKEFNCPKLIVAGNHDLWVHPGEDSYEFWKNGLKEIFHALGFHYLDMVPFIFNGVSFVGSCGWYDYSFRDERVNIPYERYKLKVLPGVVEWMDRHNIHWRFDDEQFTDIILENLERHLEFANMESDTIVCLTHHIPFIELVTRKNELGWTYGNAFMGSKRIGEIFKKYEKVKYALCGHSHQVVEAQIGNIKAINIGSTYKLKRYFLFEI